MEEELFNEVGKSIDGAAPGNLFGKPCFKVEGKAFACYFEQCMVFKLSGETHRKALSLKDSKLFDPSKKGRPMKEWVQVHYQHHQEWLKFAMEAMKYVQSTNKK